jgi:hypothetical protein
MKNAQGAGHFQFVARRQTPVAMPTFRSLSDYGHELDSNSRGSGETPNGPHRLLLSRDQASLELCP